MIRRYEEFKQKVAQGKVAPVYVFCEREEYFFAEGVRLLQEKVLGAGEAEFNYQQFYGDETDAGQIVNAALTAPMLGRRRLIVVREAQALPDQEWRKLADYARNPADSSVLVLLAYGLRAGNGKIKPLASLAEVVSCYPLFENQAVGWMIGQARQRGYRMSRAAAERLLEQVGGKLQDVSRQLDKIFSYLSREKVIDCQVVELVCDRLRQDKLYDLAQAVARRDLEASLKVLHHLLAQGEAVVTIVGMLASCLRQLWQIRCYLEQGEPPAEVARRLQLTTSRQKQVLRQAQAFTRAELEHFMGRLLALDRKFKTSAFPVEVALELLVVELCRPG